MECRLSETLSFRTSAMERNCARLHANHRPKTPLKKPTISEIEGPVRIYRIPDLKKLRGLFEKLRSNISYDAPATPLPEAFYWPSGFYGLLDGSDFKAPDINSIITMRCNVQGVKCDVTFFASTEPIGLIDSDFTKSMNLANSTNPIDLGKKVAYVIERIDVRPETERLREALDDWSGSNRPPQHKRYLEELEFGSAGDEKALREEILNVVRIVEESTRPKKSVEFAGGL